MTKNSWHSQSIEETSQQLQTNPESGLTSNQVDSLLKEIGLNKLPEAPMKSRWKILVSQFNDILIYILIIAAFVTLALAFINNPNEFSIEYFFDTIVIIVVLIINAAIGYSQEIKAEKAMKSLQSFVSERTSVIRDGKIKAIDASELVPGDIVEIHIGERIPADIRIYESQNVKINELMLTGESIASSKNASGIFAASTPIADQRNMLFMGTLVQTGTARGVVVATGSNTEIGKISTLISNIGTVVTPLQEKLEQFSKALAKLIIAISIFLIVFGTVIELLNAESRENILETVLGLTVVGVSLAVAAIPEGLPIILTFTLAISVQKMAKQNSIVRNLEAVETLGSTTVIATDKTGTLTQNRLQLINLHGRDDFVNVHQKEVNIPADPVFNKIIEIMQSTTDKLSQYDISNSDNTALIDPLDLTIYETLQRIGISNNPKKILYEFPFDSDRKMMSVITKSQTLELYLKGAPDIVIAKSTHFLDKVGKINELDDQNRDNLNNQLSKLASDGYRLIGCAFKVLTDLPLSEELNSEEFEQSLVFTGFLSFIDPPRPEVFNALSLCRQAGIRVIMITGDHPQTALAISKELEIIDIDNQNVLVGTDLDSMSDEELKSALINTNVFARVSPTHKLRLVSLLKEQGEVVGMTGDGVNDSPALVKADIGVSMGLTGTDAAKEASDMILLDDNFATLVDAVEEGRVVNDNIRKFTHYLLGSNASEVLFLVLSFFVIAAFKPLLIRELIPLSETQILYLNLVTDSFLALALGLEQKERNVMAHPPLSPNTPIVTRRDAKKILSFGLITSVASTIVFFVLLGSPDEWEALTHDDVAYAQSFVLTFLVLTEVFMAISYRSNRPIKEVGFTTNKFIIGSFVLIILGQLMILYIPLFNSLFDTFPLPILDWILILFMSTIMFVIFELTKYRGLNEST